MFQQITREPPHVEATHHNPPFVPEPSRPDIRLAPEPDDFDFEPDDHGDRAMGTSHDFEVEVEAIMKGLAAPEDDRMKIAAYTPAIALGIAAILAGIGLAYVLGAAHLARANDAGIISLATADDAALPDATVDAREVDATLSPQSP